MRGTAAFVLCAGVLSLSSACTLLIDRDGLTGGGQGGSGGADAGALAGNDGNGATSGADTAGAGVGGAAPCSPTAADIYCDGLDRMCAATLIEEACPLGCTGIVLKGVSYMACTISSTFDQAETRCQAQGMHLVKIDSVAENIFVVEQAEKLGSYVWIGGSNRSLSSTFAWIDGTAFYRDGAPVAAVYQNFGPDQPVNDPARACVQIHSDSTGYWSNTACSDAEQFICERY